MRRLPLAALLLVAIVHAQQVAPASLATVDGNGGTGNPFDQTVGYRYQQIHRHVPGPVTITAIAFRRDAAAAPTSIPRWWSEFVVRMGEGEFEQAQPSFAANYRTPPIEVFHQRRVVLPDWSVPSTASPRPFDFVLPLDVPFVHSGQHPLLWEVEIRDQSDAGVLGAIDGFSYPVFTLNQGIAYGTACGVTLTGHALTTTENQLRVWLGEWPYGYLTPRVLLFGAQDPQLVLPELCAPLRVDPFVVVDATSGEGFGMYVPYDPALAGVSLRAQTVRLTQFPLPTSNAVALTLPAMPSLGDRDVVKVTQQYPTSLVEIVRGSGVVVQLQ